MNYNSVTHEGPELPPMEPGLPHTSAEACKELLLNMLLRKLISDDVAFVESDFFLITCMYLGLDAETAVKVRLMFYQGRLNIGRLESALLGSYLRRPDEGEGAPVIWQSWARPS